MSKGKMGKMERTETTFNTLKKIMDTDGALQSDASRNLILAEIALSLSVIADILLITSENIKEPV